MHIGRLSHLKLPALSAGHRHLSDYPTPSLLYGLWGFGSLGGIGLQVQIVTGIPSGPTISIDDCPLAIRGV